MSDQDRYIHGVPCWIDTAQPDPQAALAFYGGLFGWDFEDIMPPGSPAPYHVGRIRGGDVAAVTAPPAGAASAAVWNTYVWVDDAAAAADRVRAAGGRVLGEPRDVLDQGRTAVLADPAGAVFRVWEPGRHRGATVVNEPGSLNFNTLHTGDLDGARSFYGAVFGWELVPAGGAGSMWALPAYGDLLEQRTPGLRANMAEMGAPPRFEEVVASLLPASAEEPGARWDVVFAVDDADATASRATELGGRVVVAPFDAPWVRTTVIEDPQGATFTASRFTPENKDVAPAAGATAGG